MITIIFYKNTAANNVLDKTNFLTELETKNGLFYNNFDIVNSVLVVRNLNINANYCYINELNKYFFIENVEVVDNTKVKLTLKLDVLNTYKTDIKNLYVTVREKENANGYINTRNTIYDVRPNFAKIDFPNQIFDENGQIIMITIKGNK